MAFQTTYQENSAIRPHFVALDGFRGILAVFVAIYHTIWLSWPNESAFLDNGAVIIDLFFAFSGFLMFTLYRDRLHKPGQGWDFMAKRFARLMPLHLFMLAIFVLFSVARILAHEVGLAHQEAGEVLPFEPGAVESWRNLFAHLSLTHAMGGADQLAYNPPSWTVGAEFYTYILFALMMVAWGGRSIRLIHIFTLMIGITAIYAVLFRLKPDMNITYDWGFLRCVAGFFTGVIAAFWVQRRPLRFGKWATFAEIMTIVGSTMFVIYCGGKMQFFIAPILLLFILVFSGDEGRVSSVLSRPVFGFLARISYSVYLVHVIIAIGFEIGMNIVLGGIWPDWHQNSLFGTALLFPYLVVVIGLSCLTYRWIEVPGGRWMRKVLQSRRPQPVEALSPAE